MRSEPNVLFKLRPGILKHLLEFIGKFLEEITFKARRKEK